MANLKGSDNPFPSILLEEGTEPTAPAAGFQRLYVDSTSHDLMIVDSAGAETPVAGAGGAVATDAIFDAAGDLVQGTGANTAAKLGAGTAGHVLTSNGAAAAVSWQAPAGGSGALILLEQHTASSSATLDFTTCISSTYDEYQIEIVGLIPATNAVALWLRAGTGGGPTYDTGNNYGWAALVIRAAATAVTGAETGASKIQVGYSADFQNTSTKGVSGTLKLYHPQSTALHKLFVGQVVGQDASYNVLATSHGRYLSTTAMTAFQFLFSSGNIASGTIRVYGIAK